MNAGRAAFRIPWAVPNVGKEEASEVMDAMESGWLSMGTRVQEFEERMSEVAERPHAVAVSNGTVALDLALKVLGIGPGDEVIVPALTYIATANAVIYQGATPVFADVQAPSCGADPEEVAQKINPRTKGVLVIDYGGFPCDYSLLEDVCESRGIPLIVDGAQSLGSRFGGKSSLQFGSLSTISFHAAKTLTTIEGGMIFADDVETREQLRMMRNQGEAPQRKYHHAVLGYNARMSDLHAAVGLAQLRRLADILSRRRQIAEYYLELLTSVPGVRLEAGCGKNGGQGNDGRGEDCENGWFLFPVFVNHRDEIAARLAAAGVDTRVCYPMPVYRQESIRNYLRSESVEPCPVAEEITSSVLNLPMYHDLETHDIEFVVEALAVAVRDVG